MSNNNGTKTKARHIVNISGGKDSSALAIYLSKRDFWRKQLGKPVKEPAEKIDAEYVFCDTKKELPEIYEYLDKHKCIKN